MKPTSLAIVVWLFLCAWSTTCLVRGTEALRGALLVAATLPAQSSDDSNGAQDPRTEVAELLQKARLAIEAGNFETAESYVARAETMNVKFGVLYLGDTPAKTRRDLDRAIRKAAPTRPSQRFTPGLFGNSSADTPVKNPFADTPPPAAAVAPTLDDAHAKAQAHLAKARTELDRGDLTAAEHWYRMAVEQNATFAPGEDSPPALLADLTAAGANFRSSNVPSAQPPGAIPDSASAFPFDTPATPPPSSDRMAQGITLRDRGTTVPASAFDESIFDAADQPDPSPFDQPRLSNSESTSVSHVAVDTPSSQEPAAPLLAARRALAVGDMRRAQQFLEQAEASNQTYGMHDDTPNNVRSLLEAYARLMELKGEDANTETARRRHASILMTQAEGLLRWNDLEEAERLAVAAARMGIDYAPFDAQPQQILDRIVDIRRSAPATTQPQVAAQPHTLETPLSSVAPAPSEDLTSSLQQAAELLTEARQCLATGDLDGAEMHVAHVEKLNIPDSAYGPQDDNPWLVLLEIQRARMAVTPASVATADSSLAAPPSPDQEEAQPTNAVGAVPSELPPGDDYRRLKLADSPPTESRTAGTSEQLTAGTADTAAPEAPSLINDTIADAQVLARQLSAEVARNEQRARAMVENDPQGALSLLRETHTKVESQQIDDASKDVILRRVERTTAEIEKYLVDNAARLKLQERNRAVIEQVEHEQRIKVEVQEKLALLVDEYNRLMDEQRYPEAEVVARQAQEIAPDDRTSQQLVQQLTLQSRMARSLANSLDIRSQKERGFLGSMESVEQSSVPFDDRNPLIFPDAKEWEKLTQTRRKSNERARRTEKELEIERKLSSYVSVKFDRAPLAEVIDYLKTLTKINIHLDPQGLAEEGVSSDTPISINLGEEIMLKSALNLILQPLHLSYVIQDEVLKITSEQLRDGAIVHVTYNVADLVISIPNFQPSNRMGMTGLLHDAYSAIGFAGSGGNLANAPPLAVMASNSSQRPTVNGSLTPDVLAQVGTIGGGGGGGFGGATTGFGPGGMGGGAQADFDSLIELITTTIAPQSWDEVGGAGAIQPFATNLSLVVSNTEEVHEQIVDLLDQLRRLQDLQVTIEVRFITLNDNFFERIGIDFDFDIDDNIDAPFQVFGEPDPNFTPSFAGGAAGTGPGRNVQDRDHGPSVTVGMSQPGVFSTDLDVPFRQGNFDLAVPQFGGFDPSAGASLGFAILSDLEAYFFINAAQGDRRSNVLQAPKVTLFNGQQAFVADSSQSPFVISVVPVVGDFAAAQQPVIVVLSEGTYLTVQAVVSSDRRFVRLTVVPFFSQIGEVNTFTFSGSSTTVEDSSSEGPDDDTTSRTNNTTTTTEGTTVQLPTFAFISVATTVSVPDGGSVLLGGIKRLSEGRSEFGVPILNKIPYVNRLFNNVAVGRETQSLMMMVTPRIIIQEEEEALLGVNPSP